MFNGPYYFKRNEKGVITEACCDEGDLQTLFHIEVDRLNEKAERQALKEELEQVLRDVDLVVNDWEPMQSKMTEIAGS